MDDFLVRDDPFLRGGGQLLLLLSGNDSNESEYMFLRNIKTSLINTSSRGNGSTGCGSGQGFFA